jgi:hypothetical protein
MGPSALHICEKNRFRARSDIRSNLPETFEQGSTFIIADATDVLEDLFG